MVAAGATLLFVFTELATALVPVFTAAAAAAAAAATAALALARAVLVDVGVVSLISEFGGKYMDLRLCT